MTITTKDALVQIAQTLLRARGKWRNESPASLASDIKNTVEEAGRLLGLDACMITDAMELADAIEEIELRAGFVHYKIGA